MSADLRPVRWGVLSTARITEKFLRGASQTALADIRAVASRDPETARSFASRWAIPTAHGSYDALLADSGIEAVYIPLPNSLHHEWTMRALEAGKHVLCEKPYSPLVADVSEAFGRAEAGELILSEGYMYRYNPQIRRLVEIVQGGLIGPLRLISASFTWPTYGRDDIRLSPELDGGSLLDVGCYCVSAARLLAGEPSSATAAWVIGPTGVEVRLVGSLAFEGAASDGETVLAALDSGFHLPDRSALEVVGTLGNVHVRDPWHCLDPGLEIAIQGQPLAIELIDVENSYRLELEAFARAVRGLVSPLLGRTDAVGQAMAIGALYQAARTGQTIQI